MFCAQLRQQAQYGLGDCCLTASSPVGIMLLYSSASGNLYLTHPSSPNTMCVKTPWPQPLKMSSLVAGLVVHVQGPIPQKRLLLMRPNQATCCLSRPQSVSYCPSAAGQGRLGKSDSVFHLYHHFKRVEEA